MISVSNSTLRSKMNSYFDKISNSFEVLIIPRKNKEEDAMVIMPIKENNSLQEISYLLSTRANCRRLEESITQLEEGKVVPYVLEDELP